MSKKNPTKRGGFTLVELMLATVLAAIIMMAAGSVLVSLWRKSADFNADKLSMQEIDMVADLFQEIVRKNSVVHSDGQIECDALDSMLKYDPDTLSIIYSNNNSTMTFLEGAVTQFDKSAGDLLIMEISVIEKEMNKTNTFTFAATPRNYSSE